MAIEWFAIDVRTALVLSTVLMLMNGAVLGLMHRSLPVDVRPAAMDWRVGTLLAAFGPIVLALQGVLPIALVAIVGNAYMNIGFTLYWRALRRFRGLPDTPWLFLPAAVSIATIAFFAWVTPIFAARIVSASLLIALVSGAAAMTLMHRRWRSSLISERVLSGILLCICAFACVRAVYYGTAGDVGSILDSRGWISNFSPVFLSSLPVIGTTAFLLMCAERLRRQWEEAAATDYLTGLPNRRTIASNGEARFNAARRNQRPFAVAIVDIDHFKSINDQFGHATGDLVLRQVASILDASCRGPSMVGRIGGEEFVALLEDADSNRAIAAAERIRAAVAQMRDAAAPLPRPVTVSIGVAVMDTSDGDFGALLRRADHALYAAKRDGRNRVEFDHPVTVTGG